MEELDLREVTLVAHDWGGPLGFRLAVTRPELIARLVVLNTGIFSGCVATRVKVPLYVSRVLPSGTNCSPSGPASMSTMLNGISGLVLARAYAARDSDMAVNPG